MAAILNADWILRRSLLRSRSRVGSRVFAPGSRHQRALLGHFLLCCCQLRGQGGHRAVLHRPDYEPAAARKSSHPPGVRSPVERATEALPGPPSLGGHHDAGSGLSCVACLSQPAAQDPGPVRICSGRRFKGVGERAGSQARDIVSRVDRADLPATALPSPDAVQNLPPHFPDQLHDARLQLFPHLYQRQLQRQLSPPQAKTSDSLTPRTPCNPSPNRRVLRHCSTCLSHH